MRFAVTRAGGGTFHITAQFCEICPAGSKVSIQATHQYNHGSIPNVEMQDGTRSSGWTGGFSLNTQGFSPH